MSRTPADYSLSTATPVSGDFIHFIDISDGFSIKKVAVSDFLTAQFGGTAITATATELNSIATASSRYVAGGSTLTLTAALHANKTIKLDTASGTVCTLPAASGTGNIYRFQITTIATSNSHIIKVANSSDTMVGMIWTMSDDPATVKAFKASGTDDTITLNRSTTGSTILGEWIEVIDYATNLWHVKGMTASTGTEATPFSATV